VAFRYLRIQMHKVVLLQDEKQRTKNKDPKMYQQPLQVIKEKHESVIRGHNISLVDTWIG